jgi:hypothetical protein
MQNVVSLMLPLVIINCKRWHKKLNAFGFSLPSICLSDTNKLLRIGRSFTNLFDNFFSDFFRLDSNFTSVLILSQIYLFNLSNNQ